MQTRKVCLIGDFGVGKTSLAARFINNEFSDKYLTTVGVKVDTKTVELESGESVKFILWDIAGTDSATPVYKSYLKGAGGYLLVADGTRAYTLDNALQLRDTVQDQLGDLPFIGLLNKADLSDEWELDNERIDELKAQTGADWLKTSAKSGDHVEEAFKALARALL